MRKPKFEIFVGQDGKIYFRLKAANGETVMSGRGFKTKPETIHAIASVMRYGSVPQNFIQRTSTAGQHYFQLKSPNGRILGWSEQYVSRQGRDNGIAAVVHAAKWGRVLDLN
jgi:uncharacterized protein